ncbi:prepilin-type N-terminal cleavage/methylation domain-containing protein [Candidatus Parcubacteria bacterium]|nr:prepilin-type N-terminal cleavage/methylation domain-containing protein [Patescibacteria group bacterium]MBU4482174.1 prepilin-type N-terminal cleavage/methylation domain-containing protein [Patescibacteria group bacterium]MCG2686542.1 prepilin-type N-terminal cleavage/methylation domain-containing protein [Candidatus Parcubacteria bacterium]
MKNKGFTLLELIVAISIFVLATFAVSAFIVQSFRAQNFSLEQSGAITEARRGIETLVKELREALPGDTGAYPIEFANDQEIIFYADYDRDNAIEKVHYWLDGSDFKKNVIEASGSPLSYSEEGETEIISRFVRNNTTTIFTYYDGDYTTSATPADPNNVKLIHIYLKINVNPQRAPTNFELESDVSLRNLKENL